ncbi:reverse transcriptase domain-containing protein [Tanacetum coccineum]
MIDTLLTMKLPLISTSEAYVDDMVIKIMTEQEMIMDVAESFDNLRRVNMKLNPKKCSFGVKEGKFLGYMVTSEGIRANPKKTKAVADMQSPRTLKEMQSLSRKLAALNRFLSRLAKRTLPFFETLKNITKDNKNDFRWTDEAEQAFQEMKKLILELPTLTTPGLKEMLYAYLTISKDAVSGVLIADRGANKRPFDTLAGRFTKPKETTPPWRNCLNETCPRLVMIDLAGTEYTYAIRLNFASTNNEAEYEALLAGLRIAEKMKVRALKVKVDSKLVACQLNGEFVASSEGMAKYLAKAKELSVLFKKFSLENVPWNQNQKTDVLKAKPLAKTTSKEVKKFVWEDIVCRFGLSRVIVTDNGTQLVNDPFKSWCEKWKIKQKNIAVAHPQANGLVERANKSLMHGLKARLGWERVGWVDELPNILWAHQTMLKTSTGETPFSLTYGSEAVIPAEIGVEN